MNLLPITGDFVRALGWTILHSMWQAFFIYACLRIVLKLWPLAGARIRYNLSLLSLSGIFTWFLATLYMHMQRLQEARDTIIQLHGPVSLQAPVPMEAVYHSQDPLIWLFPNLELCFPMLVTLYIAGMTGMIIKLCSDLFQLHQIRTTRIEPMGAAWDKHLDKLAARLQIPRKVKLLISRHVQVPVMLGFLKPLILLPVAMVNNLTEEQLEAVLLHELAHIKRNDYLLNIFQSIVETILFFNPFVWLISKTIRIEREHCCDDLVIANTVQPLQYAHALVALEQYRLTANRLTMAAADSKQHLFHRIKRIMEMKTKHLNYSQKFLAVLIIATGLVSIAWLNPAKGKSNETTQKKIAEKKQIDAAPRKDATTTIDYVSAPSSVTKDHFKHQLNAVCVDTAILEMPTPPSPPSPPSPPNAIPAPPLAPISPLKGELAAPQPPLPPQGATYSYNSNYSFHKIGDSDSTPLTIYSKVNVNTANNVSSSVHYNNATQVNKEEIRKQIQEAQHSIQLAMKQLKDVDMKKVQAEVQAATKNINWEKVSAETRKAQAESIAALKNIDWDQINKAQAEAAAALKNIDFQSISKNLNLAYKSLNVSEEVRKQVDEARQLAGNAREYSGNQLEEVRKQRAEALEDAANARREAAKTREENSRAREDVNRKLTAEQRDATEKTRKIAAEQREAAAQVRKVAAEQRKATAEAYREMLRQMEADNLLNTQKEYKVEKNDNGLFINDVKQSDKVADKYSKYLKAKRVMIKGSSNTSSTNVEN